MAVAADVQAISRRVHEAARRASELGTESAFDVGARATRLAAAGHDVLRLEIGQPDWGAPDSAIAAAIEALRAGETGYTAPAGLPALRAAIAGRSAGDGAPLDPSRIFVLPGGKPGLFFAAQLLLEAGDEALVPDPGFPIYPSIVRFAGATPVPYALQTGNAFRLDVEALEASITDRTRVIFLNSPHNPTGATLSRRTLERVAELALAFGFTIVADEVYRDLQFDGRRTTIAGFPELSDRVILVDSLSKRFGMTGWRLGWAVVPQRLTESFERLIINNVSCVPPFIQRGGIAALAEPAAALHARVRVLRAKRDALVSGLDAVDGVRCSSPAGGLYAFPDVTGLVDRVASGRNGNRHLATEHIASLLLERHGVATLAGTGFGAAGANHLRVSFAAPFPQLHEAVTRVRAFAAGLESHG